MNASAGTSQKENPPSRTLYCTNLPDKINKQDLRRCLYLLFSTYGVVLDVVALKTMKMRGQAHIVFRDVQASTQAMKAMQGLEIFGKEIKISYAKGKSHVISKLDGTGKVAEAKDQAIPGVSTALQKSIFGAAPGSPAKDVNQNGVVRPASEESRGIKRGREDSDDDEEVPMDEDDEGAEMEMSEEED